MGPLANARRVESIAQAKRPPVGLAAYAYPRAAAMLDALSSDGMRTFSSYFSRTSAIVRSNASRMAPQNVSATSGNGRDPLVTR